jgi:bifunctional UDP-N-acetylglucosamine pyrophosphorylase/glucosamine-1-phosphate N-acetyltransferase
MKNVPIACVILCAGQGTRMKSSMPKVLHAIAGLPMMGHVLYSAAALNPEEVVAVIGPKMPEVEQVIHSLDLGAQIAVQQEALGTGHAVKSAADSLEGFEGKVLVLYGDTPLIEQETLEQMAQSEAAVTVLGMRPEDPAAYGRLICDEAGNLQKIVEFKDANAEERAVNLCNSGVMAVEAKALWGYLEKLTNDNANGEYYLTDVVAMAVAEGKKCAVIEAEESSLLGVNDRNQLAQAEAIYQQRARHQAMQSGVTLQAPETVTFCYDTEIANDVVIEPNVVFAAGVEVASGARIRAFSYLEGCSVGEGAVIGPYARLRPGANIGKEARIGNFVEIKNADLEEGAKVNHLSYVGDAHVGTHANIGAGTITCNYDGFQKYRTTIGDHAFIGSNSALVAPVEIGEGAIVGAGSTITEDVDPDALAMTRPQQLHRAGWAQQFRTKRQN